MITNTWVHQRKLFNVNRIINERGKFCILSILFYLHKILNGIAMLKWYMLYFSCLKMVFTLILNLCELLSTGTFTFLFSFIIASLLWCGSFHQWLCHGLEIWCALFNFLLCFRSRINKDDINQRLKLIKQKHIFTNA